MSKPVTMPFSPRNPDSKNSGNQIAEHGQAPGRLGADQDDALDTRLEEGGDAGTKGTGSAG